jgi:hypothetical protein
VETVKIPYKLLQRVLGVFKRKKADFGPTHFRIMPAALSVHSPHILQGPVRDPATDTGSMKPDRLRCFILLISPGRFQDHRNLYTDNGPVLPTRLDSGGLRSYPHTHAHTNPRC